MILLCPKCHWSMLLADDEVARRGGPSACQCGACSTPLDTLDGALGLTGLSTASEAADELRDTGTLQALERAPGGNHGTPAVPMNVALAKATVRDLSDLKPPPGQLIIGELEDNPAMTTPAMSALKRPDAPQHTGAMAIQAAMLMEGFPLADPDDPDATQLSLPTAVPPARVIPAPALRSDATKPAVPVRKIGNDLPRVEKSRPEKGGRQMGLALLVGGALLAGLLLLAGGGALAYYFSSKPSGDNNKTPDTQVGDQLKSTPPARPPLDERMRELVQNHSNTSVPAIELGGQLPNESEVILLTPNGIVYGKEMVASTSLGRVATEARPSADSPLIVPLARQLEATFSSRIKDAIDAEAEPRWVIALADGTVPYGILYSVLYTSWERGARLQLATTNPKNPNAYLASDITPYGWPAPITVGAPDDLPPQNPASATDNQGPLLRVTVSDKGFTIDADGDEEEAMVIERLDTYPVRKLRKECQALRQRHGKLSAVLIQPHKKTTFFTLLQTISATTRAWEGTPAIDAVWMTPPK